jgi:hypothetical protein
VDVSPWTVADRGRVYATEKPSASLPAPPASQPPAGRRSTSAAYLARKPNRPHPVTLLAADLSHVHVRVFLRREIWKLRQGRGW